MKISQACKHCGATIIFRNVDEPTDCPGCQKPWLVNSGGVLVKLYRPPDKRRRRPWRRGK